MKDERDDDQLEEPLEVEELSGNPFDSLTPEEDVVDPDLEDFVEEDDPEEMERRRLAYAGLKKVDKIFNNTFTMGQVTTDEPEEPKQRSDIKLDSSSPDYHLYDRDQHSDYVDNSIIQQDIHNFVSNSDEVKQILGPDPDKKKFNKTEVNTLFEVIRNGVSHGERSSVFVSAIHVLDSISSLTGLEYKKLFDMFTYENKEVLLIELDKKYNFLNRPATEFKIYE